MRKPIRLISLLLAMVLCFSCTSIGVQAMWADYNSPSKNALDHYVISAEQCASMILDKIDLDVLGNPEKAKDFKGKIDVPGWLEWICDDFPYDLTSIDKAFDTLIRLYDSDIYDLAGNLDLGDLQRIKINDIQHNCPTRTSPSNTDLDVVLVLFRFLRTNKNLIGKIIDGQWDNGGIASYFIDVNETVGNIHQKIKEAAYNALFPNSDELPKGSDGKPIVNADSSTLDQMVNYYVSDLLSSEKIQALLPSLQTELGANFNLNNITIYELLRKVLRTAINDYVRPMLTDLLADNEMIWPILSGILGMTINDTDESGNPRPKDVVVQEMVDDLLDFKNGTLHNFIKVEDDGIYIGDNYEALINQLMETAHSLMGTLGSFDTVDMLTTEELQGLSNPEMLAYIGRTLLLSMVDYMDIPLKMPSRQDDGSVEYIPIDGYGLVTYALINVMLDKMPQKDYYGMIQNYIDDEGSEDQQLNPGQKEVIEKDAATGRVTVYKEPAAFTILADYLYYYLNAKTTMEIPQGLNFDETMQWIFIWAVNQWGGLVRTDNLNLTTQPDIRDMVVWKNLDALLWDNVLNINWLPANFGTSFKTVSNGVTTYTGTVTRKVLIENLLYPLVSLNLNSLSRFLEVFKMNPAGELNQNVINFILTLLKRLLNGMFQQTDRIFGGTSITKLEDIVDRDHKYGDDSKTNLRIIAENLCQWLPEYGQAILRSALPLVAEILADMDGVRVDKHNYDIYPPVSTDEHGNPINYSSIDYLRQLMEVQRPSNVLEADMMTDPNYFFFGGEDFDPLYRFYNYRETYREAQTLIEMYDNEVNMETPNYAQYQEDIDNLTYRLEYYFGRLSLRDPVIDRLYEELQNAKGKFGYGARGSATAHGSKFNSEDFTLRTWTAYQKAVEFAQRVYSEYLLDDGNLRQSKITAARRLLIQAQKNLKFMGGEADYSVLIRLISLALSELNAGKSDPGLYTEQTLSNLEIEYKKAIKVDMGYDASDQDIIDEAAAALEAAIGGLINYPQLIKVANKTTVLDKTDWTIWGVAEGLRTYFSYVTNLGSGFVNYNYTPNGSGTGTEIFLEDEDGNVIENQKYTIIVFGDVDGDSYADATDANIVYAYCAQKLPPSYLTDFAYRAADADGDGWVDTLDARALQRAGLKLFTVDQRGVI